MRIGHPGPDGGDEAPEDAGRRGSQKRASGPTFPGLRSVADGGEGDPFAVWREARRGEAQEAALGYQELLSTARIEEDELLSRARGPHKRHSEVWCDRRAFSVRDERGPLA